MRRRKGRKLARLTLLEDKCWGFSRSGNFPDLSVSLLGHIERPLADGLLSPVIGLIPVFFDEFSYVVKVLHFFLQFALQLLDLFGRRYVTQT